MILFCFHYAGGTAAVYKQFCVGVEGCTIVPIQLPGRENRHSEPFYKNLDEAVDGCYKEIKQYIDKHNVKEYGFVAHSMGTWIAYGVYKRSLAFPPKLMILSCFPSPRYAKSEKKIWRINKRLTDLEFQDELRKWGVREIVFQDRYWNIFRGMLKADFNLFDNYDSADIIPIRIPKIVLIHSTGDQMISKEMVMDWVDIIDSESDVKFHEIHGKHLFMEDALCKKEWESIVMRSII